MWFHVITSLSVCSLSYYLTPSNKVPHNLLAEKQLFYSISRLSGSGRWLGLARESPVPRGGQLASSWREGCLEGQDDPLKSGLMELAGKASSAGFGHGGLGPVRQLFQRYMAFLTSPRKSLYPGACTEPSLAHRRFAVCNCRMNECPAMPNGGPAPTYYLLRGEFLG